jgi:hypothetical protein
MASSHIVLLRALPLTAGGAVGRNALSALDVDERRPGRRRSVPLRSPAGEAALGALPPFPTPIGSPAIAALADVMDSMRSARFERRAPDACGHESGSV